MKTRLFILTLLLAFVTGCASTHQQTAETAPPQKTDNDPFEGFNRAVFGFNNGVDKYLLKPVAKGYKYVTPDFVEDRFSSFFANLLELGNIFNALLQGKGGDAANYSGRFLFNTTFGFAGFFDVAHEMGLEKTDGEDFGQTLGVWGFDSGPYIVLPFLGPTTVRDGLALPVDNYTDPVSHLDHVRTRNALTLAEIIELRARLLSSEELISGDRYVFIRDAYLQRREYLVNDGEVEDTFGQEDPKGDF